MYKVYVADYTDCPDIIVSSTDYDALGEALNREKRLRVIVRVVRDMRRWPQGGYIGGNGG